MNLLAFWLFCLTGEVAKIKFDIAIGNSDGKGYISGFAIALIIVFACVFLNPF